MTSIELTYNCVKKTYIGVRFDNGITLFHQETVF